MLPSAINRLVLTFLFTLAAAAGSAGQAWAQPHAYVTNLGSDTVSVIDLATQTVIASIPVSRRPSWVAIAPDGKRAYVTHDEANAVAVIDSDPGSPTFNTVLTTIFASASNGIAITPDGSRAYVTGRFTSWVDVIDTTTNVVAATIPGLAAAPYSIALTPDGKKAYVTHATFFSVDHVSVIDTDPASPAFHTLARTIPLAAVTYGVAVAADGTRAYAVHPFSNTVSVIRTSDDVVTGTVPIDGAPIHVAIAPNGIRAYATRLNDSAMAVVDTAPASPTFHTVLAVVPVGSSPNGVAVTPDGAKVLTANSFGSSVSILDTATNATVATVGVGSFPTSVAITPTQEACGSQTALIAQLRDQVAALQAENAGLTAQNDGLRTANAELNVQLEALRAANGELAAQVNTLNAAVQALTQANAALQQENVGLRADLSAARAALEGFDGQVAGALQLIEADLRAAFSEPGLAIPGATSLDRLHALIDAVLRLEKGRKMGVYTNLGGKPGSRR